MPANHSVNKALSLIENDTSKILGLTVGKHKVQPGQYIPRADAQSAPEMTFSALSPDKTYMVVNLDLDAPFPSFGILGPILHWIQGGLKPTPAEDGTFTLKVSTPFVANYIGPAPPPGSSPHRYVFFLYEEPEGFDVNSHAPANGANLSNWYRMRYDLGAWEEKIKLGPVIAVNYFTSN